jgi:hypothetical protein
MHASRAVQREMRRVLTRRGAQIRLNEMRAERAMIHRAFPELAFTRSNGSRTRPGRKRSAMRARTANA